MDASKIEKFIDAGYTKADIDLLFSDPKIPAEEPERTPEADPAPADNGGNNMSDFATMVQNLTNTVNGLTETVKALQTANVNNANSGRAKKDTIADTMKSFIDTL